MRTRRPAWLMAALTTWLVFFVPIVRAQPADPGADNAAAAAPEAAPAIRFTFKDAPLDQVIDVFSRETGLPVIRETDLPQGAVTFISAHAYPLEEAMRILNTILQTRGIMLRRDAEFLYLGKLEDQQREPVPTFVDGELPDDVSREQIVSVVVPLNNAAAAVVAEQLKPLVAGYGAIVPMAAQNSLIITETAAQCRRLQSIIDALDARPAYEESVEIFPLEHIRAADAVSSLTVLVAEKKTTVVFDQQGNRRVVSEDDLAGVRMQADERTNSIIVLGSESRIRTVERLIDFLDVAGTGRTGEEMATFDLATLSADEASRHIATAFARTPEEKRPTVIPMGRLGRLTVVGTAAALSQVRALIGELEGVDAAEGTQGSEQRVAVVPLEHVDANAAVTVIRSLLNARQQQTLRISPAPGSRAVVIAGPAADIETARQVVTSIDAPAAEDREYRVLKLGQDSDPSISDRARAIYADTSGPGAGEVTATLDADRRSLTLVGTRRDLDRFAAIVRTLADADPAQLETRTYRATRQRPTQMAQAISRAVQTMLAPTDGSPYTPPVFEPSDPLNILLVRATPRQFAVIDSLLASLDRASQDGDTELRTYRVLRADLNAAANTLRRLSQTGGLLPPDSAANAGAIVIETEPISRTIIASAPGAAFERIERVLSDLESAPREPESRMIFLSLTSARADQIAGVVSQVLTARARDTARELSIPAALNVQVLADKPTNSLILTIPEPLVDEARELVARLDTGDGAASTREVVRIVTLTFADAGQTAAALQQTLRTARIPSGGEVSIAPSGASNAIVLSGDEGDLNWVINIIRQLDTKPQRDTLGVRTIYLRHGRAERIAPLVERLLNGEQMNEWARLELMRRRQPGAEDDRARVVAEPRLNAITVTASPDLLAVAEEVVLQLDAEATDAAPMTSVRILTLTNADANEVAGNISAVFNDADAASGEPAPIIRVDRASNALIVRATPGQFDSIDKLVSSIDRAAAVSSRQIRTIRLDPSRADAAVLAQALRQMLREQGEGVEVEVISADELLDRADDESGEPVSTLDPAPADALPVMPEAEQEARRGVLLPKRVKMILNYVQTVVAVAPGADLLPDGLPPGDEDTLDAAGLTIAVDRATNTLIIVGSSRVTARAEALARAIERDLPRAPGKIRLVELPAGADANQMIQLVRATLSQADPTGVLSRVALVPHPDADAMLVAASDKDFEQIARLISVVARPGKAEAFAVRVYPLSTVSAARAAQAVTDLVSNQPTGRQAARFRGSGASGREFQLNIPMPDGTERAITIDPAMVRVASGPADDSLIVTAPAEILPAIDRFIEILDQSPIQKGRSIRTYALEHAGAAETAQTLQRLFVAAAQGRQGGGRSAAPQFVADERTGSILIAGTDAEHEEVGRLVALLDTPAVAGETELALIHLDAAQPSRVSRILEDALIGRDAARRDRISIGSEDSLSLLIVRAPKDELEQARAIIAEIDRPDVGELPVRSIKLERADAQAVATALQRFFDDRARAASRPGRNAQRRIALVGDRRSSTLIVSATEEDFAQVTALVETFDAPSMSQDLQFRVIPLENARVADVGATIQELADELQWSSSGGWWNPTADSEKLIVRPDQRTNSIVVLGTGEAFDRIEGVVRAMDTPMAQQEKMAVRVVKVDNADLRVVRTALERVFSDPNAARRWWEPADPRALKVETDPATRSLILIAPEAQLDEAAELVAQLDQPGAASDIEVQTVALTFANAERSGQSLSRFFADRARLQGLDRPAVSVVGSRDGNTLILSGPADDLALARDLLSRLDQPEVADNRSIEVLALEHGEAQDVSRAVSRLFPSGGDGDARVTVTSDVRTNSVIISAPNEMFPQVQALVAQMDTPPAGQTVKLRTFTLKSARAEEVAQTLRAALELRPAADARAAALQGVVRTFQNEQGEEVVIRAAVTPDRRSNALIVTADDPSMEIVGRLIAQLDEQPAVAETEYRVLTLKHAKVDDVEFTLSSLLRRRTTRPGESAPSVSASVRDNTLIVAGTSDQIGEIEKILAELDTPSSTKRQTEFMPLKYADAEAAREALRVFYGRYAPEAITPGALNVSIVADPATNSLVISADETEWAGIRALLAKLDAEEYDASRRLEVLALKHADAQSVATALQQAFEAPLRAELERERQRQAEQNNRRNNGGPADSRFFDTPTVLIATEEVVSVAAEPLTNSLIVSASRKDMERVRSIVDRLDVPDFAKLPPPRVLPIQTGRASELARVLSQMYELSPAGGRARSLRSVSIIGDDPGSALIVRATDDEFTQIKALADALQQERMVSQVTVRVLPLHRQPAARIVQTVLRTFGATAQERNEPLAVEAERTSNALVIASSKRMFDEIERVVRELDGPAPDPANPEAAPLGLPNQGVFIIEIKNTDPAEVKRLLEQMGLSREPAADRPGIVSEPITVVALTARRAIAVTAAPADGAIIAELVRSIDADPINPEQEVALIPLRVASAANVASTLERLLAPGQNDAQTALARTIAEQVRRLKIRGETLDQPDMSLDLSVPIRIDAETQTNAILVASSSSNVGAVKQIISLLDRLPIGDAVTVRVFHLTNASSERLASVVRQLFQQGESLRRTPGTEIRGEPTTVTGKALAGEIAVAVDERTNALIVAGREEAVALAEVLIEKLDSSETANWIEPRLITLRFADATRLADTLRRVLVEGIGDTPEAASLQRQIGRLRIIGDGGKPEDALESQLFAPMTRLIIEAEEELNAVIVLGAPANINVVAELIKQLDVEGASWAESVRVYPLRYAAADRVADLLRSLFKEQVDRQTLRTEDDLSIYPDLRSNSLVIATSQRSFAVVDQLLKTLDAEGLRATVGVHVVPVGRNDARQLAPKVERLMQAKLDALPRGARSGQDIVSIQADEATNTLIVACSEENLALVKQLVETLSNEEFATGAVLEIFPLRSARAADMVRLLQELYVNEITRTRGEASLRVRADDRLNAVVVNGMPDDIASIKALIARLDGSELAGVREIKVIPLASAHALEMVNLLENVLSGRSIAGTRESAARQATILRFVRDRAMAELPIDELTETEVSAAIREQVTLTPDLRTNAVVVSAPPPMMVMIETLIADLDSSASGARRIKVFELVNSDAEQMAELLRDLFNLRRQGNLFVLVPTGATPSEENPTGVSSLGLGDMTLTMVPDERQELAITIDPRTNTLLVSGTAQYLELVDEVVTRLDSQKGVERQQVTYELKNARVEEVANALQTFIRQEQDRISRVLGPDQQGSAIRRLENEISVVGVPGSSRLILSASPRYMETVMSLIEELDRAPAQVMIQVLLAEVTLDSEQNWGVDFVLKPQGSRDLEGALRAAGTGVLTAIGVPNLSVSTLDFDLLIRALEIEGKLEVLSRPQVLVNDNEDALIQVGEDIQIVTDIQRTDAGNTISTTTQRNVGVILNVTPSISPDGFVRMDIEPEISALTARTTQISEDFEAPIISTRKARTTVTVKDGQTIVIGGLIQSQNELRKTKVPGLGDIPIIGNVFRSSVTNSTKTELVIVLRPRVIISDRDLRGRSIQDISRSELERMSLSQEVKDQLDGQMYDNGPLAPIEDEAVDNSRGWKTTIRTGRDLRDEPDDTPPPPEGEWVVKEQEEPVAPPEIDP